MKESPFVSVIVPTYNRCEKLSKCLNALTRLHYPPNRFEVFIIDDGSTDNTLQKVKKIIAKKNNFHYISQTNSGPAVARNKGIGLSKGEIIFFVDDDDVVPNNWIRLHLKWYVNKMVAGVGGNHFAKKISWADSYYIARYLEEFLEVQRWTKKDTTKGLATANCSYRKKVLKEVKGFDESFPIAAGEDIDLTQRIMRKGYEIIKDPEIITEHLRSETISSTIRLKFKRMSGAVIDNKKNPNTKLDNPFKRIIVQWKNFKKMKRTFFKSQISSLDCIKFIYLSVGIYFADIYGRFYFGRKLKDKKL